MKTQKMSLANIQGKLSRNEMKQIMAGSSNCGSACNQQSYCCDTKKTDTCCNLEAAGCSMIVGSDGQGCI